MVIDPGEQVTLTGGARQQGQEAIYFETIF